MAAADPHAQVVCQAAHDCVRALLGVSPDSVEGSAALREVVLWLAREHGPVAVLDLAEELAVDLAEAFDALAAVEGRDPLAVADAWFHDRPVPEVSGLDAEHGRADPLD